jgi:hypothetical protein
VFDETFLQTSLSEHIKAKGTENADQPSVHVTLRNGQKYKIVWFVSYHGFLATFGDS